MSELRDARLHRALADAPDAQLLPGARTRQAVLDAAREAVMPVPEAPAPWWKKLWQTSGDRRAPWNAAFATLVLASLVTVLWYEREVPEARTESGDVQSSRSPPASTPTPAPTPGPAPAAAPQAIPLPGTVQPPALVATSRPAAAPRPAAATRSADALPPVVKPEPPTPSARPIAPAEIGQAPNADGPDPAQARRELPRAEATDALRDQNVGALSKSAPRVPEASRAAETAGAAAPSPAAPVTAPAAALAARSATSMVSDWTHLRLTDQARSVEVARDQAARVGDLVSGVVRNAQGAEPLEGTVDLRVEFKRAGQFAGLLEVASAQVRWTRGQGAQGESFTARPSARELQALREEIERLMPR